MKAREIVKERCCGVCEVCGKYLNGWDGYSLHHRQPRQSGGTNKQDRASNLIAACGSGATGCHGHIESQRRDAYDTGLLVHSWEDPADTPVQLHRGLVLLHDDGTVTEFLEPDVCGLCGKYDVTPPATACRRCA